VLILAANIEIQAAERRVVAVKKPDAGPLDLEEVSDLSGEGPQFILKTLSRILLSQGQSQQYDLALLELALMAAELLELDLQFVSRVNQLAHANLDVGEACRIWISPPRPPLYLQCT
jgi:hypothetical protein